MMLAGMCEEIAGVQAQLAALVTRLDPDDLPASAAPGLWQALDGLARQVAAAKVLVARRVDDSMVWKREGFSSAAEFLAARGGTSIGVARRELDTSKAPTSRARSRLVPSEPGRLGGPHHLIRAARDPA